MTQDQIVTAWTVFAQRLIERECPKVKVNPADFGTLMGKVVAKYGAAESILWESQIPQGTEDRTWVRAWLCRKGVKAYADMVTEKCLDGAHALRCLNAFQAVGG